MPYQFGEEFQRGIIAAAWGDPEFLARNTASIRPDFFTDEINRSIAECLVEFFHQEGEPPTLGVLVELLHDCVAPGREYSDYEKRARRVYRLIGKNDEYYKRHALKFARTHAVANAIEESQYLIEEGRVDEAVELVDKAGLSGSDAAELYYNMADGVRDRWLHYSDQNGEHVLRITTGIPEIDEKTDGGLGPGELGVFVALPNHGKSTALVHIGGTVAEAGYNVLHVTLENSRHLTSQRYDAWFAEEAVSAIRDHPNRWGREAKEEEALNRIVISYHPTKSLTVGKLRSLITGCPVKPDVVIVDYADLMLSPLRGKDRRHEVSDIYDSLRNLAGELQTRVWTGSQANRPGFDERTLTMANLSESHEKACIADLIITMNMQQKEYRRGDLRLFVAKSRLGEAQFTVSCSVNWHTAHIESDEVEL